MRKTNKTVAVLLIILLSLACLLTSCGEEHVCGHVCSECGKCTDGNCSDPVCADKCLGHEPTKPTEPTDPVEPEEPTKLATPIVTLDGNTVSWQAVEHADGYEVFVNSVKTAVSDCFFVITDTTPNDYVVTVIAIADPMHFTSSDASQSVTYVVLPPDKPYVPEIIDGRLTMGSFATGSNGELGDISWLVLYSDGQKALVISEFVLDCAVFGTDCDWESSTLRTWLNQEFMSAFTNEEKEFILETQLTAEDNTIYRVDGGDNTNDKIFLLSMGQAEEYAVQKAKATDWAVHNGMRTVDGYANFWLRTPGSTEDKTAVFAYSGILNTAGLDSDLASSGVRPAMWINLEAPNASDK